MWITLGIFFILYMIDQLTKYASQKGFSFSFGDFLIFEHVTPNKGAAWSLGGDSMAGSIAFTCVSVIASGILFYICLSKNDWKKKKLFSSSMTLILAGCFANLFDRLLYVIPATTDWRGGVEDMISFGPLNFIYRLFTGYNFPTFNMADAFLVTGVCMLILWIILEDIKDRKSKSASVRVKRELMKQKREENKSMLEETPQATDTQAEPQNGGQNEGV